MDIKFIKLQKSLLTLLVLILTFTLISCSKEKADSKVKEDSKVKVEKVKTEKVKVEKVKTEKVKVDEIKANGINVEKIDKSGIKKLFQAIETKVKNKKYDEIKENIYPIKGNIDLITKGIKNPTEDGSVDNGFNMKSLSKIVNNTEKFQKIDSEILKAFQLFLKKDVDLTEKKNLVKDLKTGDNLFVLKVLKTKSMILIYRDNGVFKLVWWKEMIRVADSL